MDFKKPSKIIAFFKSFNFYNAVSFYIIWYACVLGATFHYEKLAILVSSILVAIHFIFSKTKTFDLAYLVIFIIIGFVADELFLYFKVIHYPQHSLVWNILGVPVWILMLYIGFSTTMNHSLKFTSEHRLSSIPIAGIGGGISYLIASYGGLIQFPIGDVYSLIVISIYWGMIIGMAKPLQKII